MSVKLETEDSGRHFDPTAPFSLILSGVASAATLPAVNRKESEKNHSWTEASRL